jgi:hypothetical protein
MRCPSCGSVVPIQDLECSRCGANVGWWVRTRGGEDLGPYTFLHVQELTRRGGIGPLDRVRIGLIGEWAPAPEILSPSFQQGPSPDTPFPQPRRKRTGRYALVGALVLTPVVVAAVVVARWTPRSELPADPEPACLRNLSKLARGLALYAEDHDSQLPPWQSWGAAASEQVRDLEVFVCPAAPGEPGYAYNAALSGAALGSVRQPDRCVMLWDAGALGPFPGLSTASQAPRHHGGDDYAFVDGHTAWRARTTYPQVDIELQP